MEEMLQIGEIVNTHGVRGDVKVYPYTDDLHRFDALERVTVETSRGMRSERKVVSVKYHKNMAILHLEGIENMDEANRYRGAGLYVSRADAVPLEDDEYYIADLIGLEVCTDEGEKLGSLKDVMSTGANDVYLVKTKDGELLIPAIRQCIRQIDLENGTMEVHLLEGLR